MAQSKSRRLTSKCEREAAAELQAQSVVRHSVAKTFWMFTPRSGVPHFAGSLKCKQWDPRRLSDQQIGRVHEDRVGHVAADH
jgi:hypothetical protein